jgi:hypothetical protein
MGREASRCPQQKRRAGSVKSATPRLGEEMSKLLNLIREQHQRRTATGGNFYISDHPTLTDEELRIVNTQPGVHYFIRDQEMTDTEWECNYATVMIATTKKARQ